MTPGFDAMRAYLARLPAGLDSHPACKMKGSVMRAYLESLPPFAPAAPLPEALQTLLEHPPLPRAWVPEVPCHALLLLMAHDAFLDEAAFLDHVRSSNRALFESLAYRVLFGLVSPKTLLTQASKRWELFHTGTTLEPVGKLSRRGGELVLRTPPEHVPLVLARAYAASFVAVVEAAGGHGANIEVERREPGIIDFHARWS